MTCKTERTKRGKMTSKTRMEEMLVGTFNVRTIAYKGANGIGNNSITVFQLCDNATCGVVGLQETRPADEVAFNPLGYDVIWSEPRTGEKKGVHGVGLAIKTCITGEVGKDNMVVECISARLMKGWLPLTGSNGGSFAVAYAPTQGDTAATKNSFWLSIDRAVSSVGNMW